MTDREKLEAELLGHIHFDKDGGVSAKEITEWVIKDRKRIVEPLVELKLCNGGSRYEHLCQGIEKTIKNAGKGSNA